MVPTMYGVTRSVQRADQQTSICSGQSKRKLPRKSTRGVLREHQLQMRRELQTVKLRRYLLLAWQHSESGEGREAQCGWLSLADD